MAALDLRAAGAELARRSRQAQKLPRKIRDREVVGKVVALLISNDRGPK